MMQKVSAGCADDRERKEALDENLPVCRPDTLQYDCDEHRRAGPHGREDEFFSGWHSGISPTGMLADRQEN